MQSIAISTRWKQAVEFLHKPVEGLTMLQAWMIVTKAFDQPEFDRMISFISQLNMDTR